MTALGSAKVSKRTWYAYGGFKNPKCWRKQIRGIWQYYILDRNKTEVTNDAKTRD